jgi:hypothetical protein
MTKNKRLSIQRLKEKADASYQSAAGWRTRKAPVQKVRKKIVKS